MKRLLPALLIAAVAAFVVPADAATITSGFTFTAADGFLGARGLGTHFHSSTGGDFGNPAGLAEVVGFGTGNEEPRGLSEYDLAGLVPGPAFVTFEVAQLGGLFGQPNYEGNIDIVAYAGNNAEDFSDWEALALADVATFDTTGLSVGDTLSFDISIIYNAMLGSPSLGIRLQRPDTLGDSEQAIVFNNFRLTTTDETVPEPTAMVGLIGLAAFGCFTMWRRRRRAG